MSDDEASIGSRLKFVRKTCGKTQEEFAGPLDISLGAYKKYERNERIIPASLIETLFDIYDVDPTWLVTGIEPITNEADLDSFENIVARVSKLIIEKQLSIPPAQLGRIVRHLFQNTKIHGEILDREILSTINLLDQSHG